MRFAAGLRLMRRAGHYETTEGNHAFALCAGFDVDHYVALDRGLRLGQVLHSSGTFRLYAVRCPTVELLRSMRHIGSGPGSCAQLLSAALYAAVSSPADVILRLRT